MSELEEKIDGWFYKHATKEPDGTHTLVMHEVHDNGARDDLLALIEAEANRRVVEALTQLLDSQVIKPEYHNGVVGQVIRLQAKESRNELPRRS